MNDSVKTILAHMALSVALAVPNAFAAPTEGQSHFDTPLKAVSALAAAGVMTKPSAFLLTRGLALGLAGVLVCATPNFSTVVTVPFFKTVTPDLEWGYVIFAMLVIIGASNAA